MVLGGLEPAFDAGFSALDAGFSTLDAGLEAGLSAALLAGFSAALLAGLEAFEAGFDCTRKEYTSVPHEYEQ